MVHVRSGFGLVWVSVGPRCDGNDGSLRADRNGAECDNGHRRRHFLGRQQAPDDGRKREKETPTENFDDAVLGFYALNGESVVRCKPDVTKESFAEVFLRVREQNPAGRILLVYDNFSSHFAILVDHVIQSLEITRVALPRCSPHLNPIGPIWNCVHPDLSPRDAEDTDAFRDLIRSAYERYAERMSFVDAWTDRFFSAERLQKLRP